jgi:hypothetical protein
MNYQKFKTLTKIEQVAIIESQVKRKYTGSRKLYGVGVYDVAFPAYIKFESGAAYHPAYTCWQNMLKRCYYDKNTTSYNPATVCEEWLQFSNFLVWWKEHFMEGFELDKDFKSLMMFGNPHQKLYSPETCQFIPKWMNLVYRTNKSGKLLEIRQVA